MISGKQQRVLYPCTLRPINIDPEDVTSPTITQAFQIETVEDFLSKRTTKRDALFSISLLKPATPLLFGFRPFPQDNLQVSQRQWGWLFAGIVLPIYFLSFLLRSPNPASPTQRRISEDGSGFVLLIFW